MERLWGRCSDRHERWRDLGSVLCALSLGYSDLHQQFLREQVQVRFLTLSFYPFVAAQVVAFFKNRKDLEFCSSFQSIWIKLAPAIYGVVEIDLELQVDEKESFIFGIDQGSRGVSARLASVPFPRFCRSSSPSIYVLF